MNERPSVLKPVGPESLADEDDFRLGDIVVRPSLREVLAGERREVLEPRVMQVLVALANAKGAVVSRDELIRRCWGGRIVSEDAINRSVSKVRQLAELGGTKAFGIETIPRVGYRMLPAKVAERPPLATSAVQEEVARDSAVEDTGNSPPRRTRWTFQSWVLVGLAALLSVAGLAAAIIFLRPHPAMEWQIVESHIPFIATPMVERAPDFSPNGSMIAYSAGPDYLHRSIYLRLLSGGEPLRLVGPPLSSYAPVWSPDGTQIAFSAFTLGEPCKIMLVAALGGQPREVGRCRTMEHPSLAWDGTNAGILFNDAPNVHAPIAIYRLDLNGGSTRQLTHPPGGPAPEDNSGSISPDGKTLAFLRQTSVARNQIILKDLATGAERVFLSTTDTDDPFAWSGDSMTLFVGRNIPWDSSLWAYPVDGSPPQRITDVTSTIGWVSSGPNGLIAVDLERSEFDIAIASPSPGQPGRTLDAGEPLAYSIAYSGDGTLAASAPRSGVTSLLLSGADGGLHELLRLKSYTAGVLTWSPDGTRLAFGEQYSPNFAITVVNRQGRVLQRISYGAQDIGGLDWSEDGSALFVTSEDAHGWRTWRVNLAHPENPQPVMPYGWMFVKTHGQMMFATRDDARGIWRLDGTPRRLTNWPDVGKSHRWELSGDRLIYVDFSNPDSPTFMALSTAGGPPKPIGYPTGLLRGTRFALNPRTGLVTYLRVTRPDTDIGWLRVVSRRAP